MPETTTNKAKCPHCGKEIEFLEYTCTQITTGAAMFDASGNIEWQDDSQIPNEGDTTYEYTCPECGHKITLEDRRGADIEEFLKAENASDEPVAGPNKQSEVKY